MGPAGPSNAIAKSLPAGTTITPDGTVVGTVTLSNTKNYIVYASVTAFSQQTDGLQCQLFRPGAAQWDDLGEDDITARATVPLTHTYSSNGVGSTTVYVFCRSAQSNYVVDVGHLYALQVGSIDSGSGPVIQQRSAPPSTKWPPFGAS